MRVVVTVRQITADPNGTEYTVTRSFALSDNLADVLAWITTDIEPGIVPERAVICCSPVILTLDEATT